MCLLIVAHRAVERFPLVVAANRDEALERPAKAWDVLQEKNPRILGGRDLQAGGTWLAVNEYGVLAALTNQPSENPDASRKSRGEIPLVLSGQKSAFAAVSAFTKHLEPEAYNPCWAMVADRNELFSLDLTKDEPAKPQRLSKGVHVFENRPMEAGTAKQRWVAKKVEKALAMDLGGLNQELQKILASHEIPSPLSSEDQKRIPETLAPCVHTENYGTRSSCVAWIPEEPNSQPRVGYTQGPPCVKAFEDGTYLWGLE